LESKAGISAVSALNTTVTPGGPLFTGLRVDWRKTMPNCLPLNAPAWDQPHKCLFIYYLCSFLLWVYFFFFSFYLNTIYIKSTFVRENFKRSVWWLMWFTIFLASLSLKLSPTPSQFTYKLPLDTHSGWSRICANLHPDICSSSSSSSSRTRRTKSRDTILMYCSNLTLYKGKLLSSKSIFMTSFYLYFCKKILHLEDQFYLPCIPAITT
jgi:hypothetical protein